MKDKESMIVGYYVDKDSGCSVITGWYGNQYQSLIESPFFRDGEPHYEGNFGNNPESAKISHIYFVMVFCKTTKEKAIESLSISPYKSKSESILPIVKSETNGPIYIKISFLALTKTLYQLADQTTPLIIEPNKTKNDQDCYQLIIKKGNYAGCCKFDTIESEAYDIHGAWREILQEVKKDAKSRSFPKIITV